MTPGIFRRGISIVWRYARRQPLVFTVSVVGAAGYAAAVVATTLVLGWSTNELIVPAFGAEGVDDDAALGGLLALLGMGLLRASAIVLRRYSAGVLTMRTAADLRRSVTNTLIDVPLEYHRAKPTGELLAHADADVGAATAVLNPLPFSVGVVFLIVFSLASLLAIDWMLAVVALVLFPSLALINRRYTDRVHGPVTITQENLGRVGSVAHESFDGALAVKTLGLAERETARMRAAADELRRSRIEVAKVRATYEPFIGALPNLGIIVLLALGSWAIDVGRLTAGDLVAAMALFGILAWPVRIVGYFLQELPRSVVATGRIDGVLAAPLAPAVGVGRSIPDGPLGLRFDEVSFRYPDGTTPLCGVSFEIAPGEVVALVGATGSGKTSLCELVVRLSDPTGGRVAVGGVDITEADPASLRRAVALVFQEPFLFADPIGVNIDAGAADPALREEAVRVAQAEFVTSLPGGFDLVVGERGVTLSGGQRQRVALARALARRPRILVLDDATSAVDPVVEAQILAGLRGDTPAGPSRTGPGRERPTTLIVAHRLSTIRLADRVVFLDGGRVAGDGSHEELLALPAYERIVRAYDAAEEAEEAEEAEGADEADDEVVR